MAIMPIKKIPAPLLKSLIFLMFSWLGLFSGSANALITIDIDDNTRVTFEAGDFDMSRYTGRMEIISVYYEDDLLMTADVLDVETRGELTDDSFFISSLHIENAVFEENNLRVGEINLKDVDIGRLQAKRPLMKKVANTQPVNDVSGAGADGLSNNSFVQARDISFDDDGTFVTIDNFETLKFVFDRLPDGQRFASQGGVLLDGMKIKLDGDNRHSREAARVLKLYDINEITLDMTVSQTAEVENGELKAEHAVTLDVREFASLQMLLNLEIKLHVLSLLGEMGVDEFGGSGQMIGLLGGIELASLDVTYMDEGLIDLIIAIQSDDLDMSPAELRKEIREKIKQSGSILPQTGASLSDPIDQFILHGGGIEFVMQPQWPMPISGFMGLMMMPDQAVSQLGIKVRHLPSF